MSASRLPSCPSLMSSHWCLGDKGRRILIGARPIPTPLAIRFPMIIWIHLRALESFNDLDVRSSGMYKELSAASPMAFLQQRLLKSMPRDPNYQCEL